MSSSSLQAKPIVQGKTGYLASRDGIRGEFSERIDALFDEFDHAAKPGVNLAVVQGGKVVHCSGYGVANVEDDIPFSQGTVSHLGSTSKHFCASAILLLEDRRHLALADSIRKFVPELPPFADAITLRHLLTMTSGLPDGLNFPLFSGLPQSAGLSRAAHLDILSRLAAPMFPPGTGMTYSNSNYLLLTLVLERVGGMSAAEFLNANLFAPLGMDSTQLVSDASLAVANKATGYAVAADGTAHRATFHTELCCDGGIQSTPDDMVKWLLHYRSPNGHIRNYRERIEAENKLEDGTSISYRLGISVSEATGRLKISHGGGMPGYLCDFAFYPNEDIGVIALSNCLDVSLFEKTDAIVEAVTGQKMGRQTEPDLPAGFYVNFSRGYAAELKSEADRVRLHLMGEELALVKRGEGQFESSKASVVADLRLQDAVDGKSPKLEIRCGTLDWLAFEPVSSDFAQASDSKEFEGRYECALLGETHHVFVEDGILCVSLKSSMRELLWRALRPRGRDVFSAVIPGEPTDTDVTVVFRRDAAGRVARMEYNLSRARGVSFERHD